MKTLRNIIVGIIVGGAVASCDFLEKTPTKMTPENYFNTPEEAESFMRGVYAALANNAFYGNGYFYIAGADDLTHWGGAGRKPGNEVITNRVTPSDNKLTNLWYVLYMGINRANMFLENIGNVEEIDETLRSQYIAEVRFLRAYYYFTLVQIWGDVPFRTESTNTVVGLDIPQTDRQTIYDFIVSEMDWAAENGLKSAAELNYQPGHVSKSAAWGILARVYLFRAGEHFRQNREATEDETTGYFSLANTYAKKVMQEGHSLAGLYGDFFIDICSNKYNTALTDEGTPANESIWEIEFSGNGTEAVKAGGSLGNTIGLQGPDLSNENFSGKEDPGFCYEYFFETPKLHDYYLKNGDLERFYWNVKCFSYQQENGKAVTGRQFYNEEMDLYNSIYKGKGFEYGESTKEKVGDYERKQWDEKNQNPSKDKARGVAKYRREYEPDKKSKGSTSLNFPVLRYSDVLLMVAETENELNAAPTALAYDCLNAVRRRAGISEMIGLDRDRFRTIVKEERAMELCFEMTRRSDLIRWGEYVEDMNALVSRAQRGADNGEWSRGPVDVYTYFQISDTFYHLPIPEIERSVNKNIRQNPGW